jgi:hypothetical protein
VNEEFLNLQVLAIHSRGVLFFGALETPEGEIVWKSDEPRQLTDAYRLAQAENVRRDSFRAKMEVMSR